jgi:hypothetical protein
VFPRFLSPVETRGEFRADARISMLEANDDDGRKTTAEAYTKRDIRRMGPFEAIKEDIVFILSLYASKAYVQYEMADAMMNDEMILKAETTNDK